MNYNVGILLLKSMPIKYTMALNYEDRKELQRIFARSENWRERQRAHTIILLDDGLTTKDVADEVGIHIRTVCLTRKDWFKRRFESLVDRPHTGAPKKLSFAEVKRLQDAATKEPLTANGLLAVHLESGGIPVHVNTIVSALKSSGFVWKRTRHSLKKNETR